MFNRKFRKQKTRFINLAEHLALQNDIVSKTMDSLLARVVESQDVSRRSDWPEIRKTAEHFSEATPAISTPVVPPPKTGNRASRASTKIEG